MLQLGADVDIAAHAILCRLLLVHKLARTWVDGLAHVSRGGQRGRGQNSSALQPTADAGC